MASTPRRRIAAGRTAAFAVFAFMLWCVAGAFVQVHASAAGAGLASHVVNLTLTGPGTGSNWPSTTDGLAATTTSVNSTVCSALPSGISRCNAFLMSISTTQLGLQISVNTMSIATGNATYAILSQWVNSSSTTVSSLLTSLTSACATALGTSLTTLGFSAGAYVVPCRGPLTYSYLPSCATGETASTTVCILSPSSGVSSYFTSYLCGSAPSSTCSSSIVVTSPSSTQLYTIVNITSQPLALEAVLSYVSDVRAAYTGTSQAVGSGTSTGGGSTSAGVTAQSVELRYRGMHATLFSTAENNRTYSSTTRTTYTCEASAGYWAFSLIAIVPLGAFFLRYVWYRGRHRAKKQERARIVADETRIMQGYGNPADAQGGGAAGPPPGVDTSANGAGTAAAQWVMDENGNYYDANATGHEAVEANASGAGGGGHGDATTQAYAGASADSAPAYQSYVDPNTGETCWYVVDETQTAAEAQGGDGAELQDWEQHPAEGDTGVEDAREGGEGGEDYQTYVDPNTGETVQYVTQEAAADADGYQTYVDPETGEMYTYAAVAAEGDGAENAEADGNADAAAASGGNVYIDPNTGAPYQYVVAPEQ